MNCEIIKKIARVAARRKELGADLIEEMMFDWEDSWVHRFLFGHPLEKYRG